MSLKLLHVLTLILWIGPPLGAYYMLYQAHQTKDRERIIWAETLTEKVLLMEHVALALLLITGVVMVWMASWATLAMPWLQKKLVLVAGVLLFEAFDIWFAHVFMRKRLAEHAIDSPEVHQLRRVLIYSALPVGLFLIPGILFFAIAKQ